MQVQGALEITDRVSFEIYILLLVPETHFYITDYILYTPHVSEHTIPLLRPTERKYLICRSTMSKKRTTLPWLMMNLQKNE